MSHHLSAVCNCEAQEKGSFGSQGFQVTRRIQDPVQFTSRKQNKTQKRQWIALVSNIHKGIL